MAETTTLVVVNALHLNPTQHSTADATSILVVVVALMAFCKKVIAAGRIQQRYCGSKKQLTNGISMTQKELYSAMMV